MKSTMITKHLNEESNTLLVSYQYVTNIIGNNNNHHNHHVAIDDMKSLHDDENMRTKDVEQSDWSWSKESQDGMIPIAIDPSSRVSRAVVKNGNRWKSFAHIITSLMILFIMAVWLQGIGDDNSNNINRMLSSSTRTTSLLGSKPVWLGDYWSDIGAVVKSSEAAVTTTFQISSTEFQFGNAIPSKYNTTLSPPLEWTNVPNGTKSFVLVVEDPDAPDPTAPKRIWKHWIVYDIPIGVTSFPEGVNPLSMGCIVFPNDWGRARYDGPSPPSILGHRYLFRLFALNVTKLDDSLLETQKELSAAKITYDILTRTMKPFIIQEAILMGTYDQYNHD